MTAPVGDDPTWLADLERAHERRRAGGIPRPTAMRDLTAAVPTLIAELRKRDAALRAVEALAVAQGDDSYVMTYALRAALAAHLAPATPPAQEDTDA